MKNGQRELRSYAGPASPLAVILLTVVGLAVYLNSLGGEFIWDDIHFIKNNLYLRSWSYLKEIFTRDVAAGSGMQYNYYRPLTVFTYLVDRTLWRSGVAGFHFSNILFHILVAVSVYFLIEILFPDRLLSFLTSLFYVVHPIHTETVAYLSGRPDALVALFMLVTFILYLKQLRRPRWHLNLH